MVLIVGHLIEFVISKFFKWGTIKPTTKLNVDKDSNQGKKSEIIVNVLILIARLF